jgi:hypothetical protein
VSRKPISLTIGREMVAESDYAASPFGVLGRVREKVWVTLGRDGGEVIGGEGTGPGGEAPETE